MATPDRDRAGDDATSHEVDRHVEAQPPREDLLDPEEIAPSERDEQEDLVEEPDVGDPEMLPDSEELPESQGADIDDAERLAEDYTERPGLHDEEE